MVLYKIIQTIRRTLLEGVVEYIGSIHNKVFGDHYLKQMFLGGSVYE
jgi:hypothetical protein